MSHELPEKSLENTVYKHQRTGRLYALMLQAKLNATGEEVVVYRSLKSGRIWVRPSAEFFDGRYKLTAAAQTQEAPKEFMPPQRGVLAWAGTGR